MEEGRNAVRIHPILYLTWNFDAGDAVSARRSRKEFLGALRKSGCAETDLYDAELIFGELVGNVARHALGPVWVELRRTGTNAILSVDDAGSGFDLHPTLPDEMSESGRGLYLVHALAKHVTVKRKGRRGASVTVTLPVRMRRQRRLGAPRL